MGVEGVAAGGRGGYRSGSVVMGDEKVVILFLSCLHFSQL